MQNYFYCQITHINYYSRLKLSISLLFFIDIVLGSEIRTLVSAKNITSKWYLTDNAGVRNSYPRESAKNITSKLYLKIQGSEIRILASPPSRTNMKVILKSLGVRNSYPCESAKNKTSNWYLIIRVRNSDPRETAKNITSKWYLKIQGSEFWTLGFIPPNIYWSEIRTITVKRNPALGPVSRSSR